MKEKYGKPETFSDPYQDWEGFSKLFRKIISKEDGTLTLQDFGIIFSTCLPAADYQEGLYYIPACFQYMMRRLDPVGSNVCGSLFWYIVHFKKQLKSDGYFEDSLQLTSELAQAYTQDFALIRLNDDECADYGIDVRYREMAKYGRSVHALTDALVDYPEYWNVLWGWLASLEEKGEVGSNWWVNISHHTRLWHILYREEDRANRRKKVIINRLHKFGEYVRHWRLASAFAARQKFYEYNRRVSVL